MRFMNVDSKNQLIGMILIWKNIRVQRKLQQNIELVLKEQSAALRNNKEIN